MTKHLILSTALLLASLCALAQPKVIAHRGHWDTEGSAQNSLAAYEKAAEIGCFASEFDVWLTADNKLIVNHDKVFKGTNIDMERAMQREICNIVLSNGENIPTLDEYLKLAARTPKMRLVLELKSLSDLSREDLAAEKVVKALKKYDLLDRTDIIAFSINACMAFRKLLPEARIFYLNGCITPWGIKTMNLTGIDYSIGVIRAHPEWVKHAHGHGLEVNVWTVNSEEDMKYCIDLGVDYITTNAPEKLQALLKK